MTQYGTASVYGIDGTIKYVATAIAAIADSLEHEHTAEIDEFKNGLNQPMGFYKSDERLVVDLTLIPKSTTLDLAKKGLAFPDSPSKINLSNFHEDSTSAVKINGDYIYLRGARRSIVRGQATLRLQAFRPLDLPAGMTVDGLVTPIS
jgi:hypothetical protein